MSPPNLGLLHMSSLDRPSCSDPSPMQATFQILQQDVQLLKGRVSDPKHSMAEEVHCLEGRVEQLDKSSRASSMMVLISQRGLQRSHPALLLQLVSSCMMQPQRSPGQQLCMHSGWASGAPASPGLSEWHWPRQMRSVQHERPRSHWASDMFGLMMT